MANTYVKISSVTLGSNNSAIEFTSIPSTYTDLVVYYSGRITANDYNMYLTFNNSGSGYSQVGFIGLGSGSFANFSGSAQATDNYIYFNSNANTASTFSNVMIYIPNYASSNDKAYITEQVIENNATFGVVGITGGLWANSSAISSIKIRYTGTSNDIAQYSTAYLYGIKNS